MDIENLIHLKENENLENGGKRIPTFRYAFFCKWFSFGLRQNANCVFVHH